jgi:tetratricopeptide (TPR) repeat protein
VIIGYFGYFNNTSVTVVLYKDVNREVPLWLVAALSSGVGILFMFIIYTIRDTRRLIRKVQTQRREKKQQKIQNLYSKALGGIHAGRDSVAIEALTEILKLDSEHIPSLLRLGEIYLNKKEYKEAQEYFKKALAIDPENTEALFNLATIKEQLEVPEEALKYIDKILEVDKNNITAMYKKREILERLKRWEELIQLQKDILSYKDEEKEREYLKGYLYEAGIKEMEADNHDKAKKYFKEVLKEDNEFIPAHIGFAELLLRDNKTAEAVEYLEKVFAETRSMVVLARLEELLLSTGEPSRIISLYKEAIKDKPSDSQLKFFLAKLYYRLEMLDDAMQAIEEIEDPSSIPDIGKIKGAIYIRRGEIQKATEEFEKVLNMKKFLRVPYCCSNCGWTQVEWAGRCPFCGRWNTFYFNIHGHCEITRVSE